MSIPANTLVADMVTLTPWSERKNRFYFDCTVAPTTLTHLEAIGNRLMAIIADEVIGIMSSQCSVLRFELRWYGSGGSLFEANSTAAIAAGQITAVAVGSGADASNSATTADTLPDEVCIIIQKRTGTAGRSKRGRWFFCGLHEGIQNAGQVDTEFRATVKDLANLLSTDITVSAGFSTVIHHRHLDNKNSVLVPITKCYALRTMGSRRDRRKPLTMSRL